MLERLCRGRMTASLKDTRSSELYRRALEVIPGGVNSPVRAMRAIGRDPIFIARGEGAELIDVDANRFIDYVCSWGPLIHGHAHPHILAAVTAAAANGTSFGAPTPGEVELASEVVRRMGGVELLRMTSSGTEAAMTAIRLARAATGREPILKFAGAYHGHSDGLLAQAGSGLATQGLPASPGVPASAAAATVVVPWNDSDALVAATERHELAAIIAEPLPANMGVVAPDVGFLALLRERADANGALLVLDEVISGFRVARGGAQELLGVSGDLVILGKIIGGGLPAAAVGGRAELMRMLAPGGEVYQAGTLSGNPVAVAAGLATLELLDEPAYLHLAAITERLADGLREAARDASPCPVQVATAPGLMTVFFSERPVASFVDAQNCDLDAYAAWCRELLARGVYPPASQFEAWFPSLAHTPEQIERTVEAATAAFACLSQPVAHR
jgi:glutamate-1-semialdehyde 2,1-aminomutase